VAPVPHLVDPRILDPRVWLRALDDIHTLSTATVSALEDLHTVAEVARGLEDVEARLTARMASAEAVLAEVAGLARGLLAFDQRAGELLEAAHVLNGAATTLAAAVEPMQGAIERLGRVTARLPGGGGAKKAKGGRDE
jgi:hypothetical protein